MAKGQQDNARVRIRKVHLVLVLILNSSASFWMYSQAFHQQLFGNLRINIVKISGRYYHSPSIKTTALRMTSVNPTDAESFLKPIISDIPSSPIRTDTENDSLRRNDNVAFESSKKIPSSPPPQQHHQKYARSPKKYHHLSVCMVPPESSVKVWETITKCRIQFNDPGLYRWPPHANLLYPFIDVQADPNATQVGDDGDNNHDTMGDNAVNGIVALTVDPTVIEGLLRACRQIEPFYVKLHQFGTFGSHKRGVLWLFPDSYNMASSVANNNAVPSKMEQSDVDYKSPLVQLQELLVESFPYCNDQNIKSQEGFNPHMTISHFINHHDALEAQKEVESWWPPSSSDDAPDSLQFPVEYIYLLQRFGDSGQFLRVADIPLGSCSSKAIVHPVPIPFVHMPTTEVDWVYQERMKLKQRRNGQWRSRGSGSSTSRASRNRTDANTTFVIVDNVMNTTAAIEYK